MTVGKLCTHILERKGSVWVARCADSRTVDAHELVILLCVHEIIEVHWDISDTLGSDSKKNRSVHCSFKKRC